MTEKKEIGWSKPIETVDGRPARLICSDRKSSSGTSFVVLTERQSASGGMIEEVATVDKFGETPSGVQYVRNKIVMKKHKIFVYGNKVTPGLVATMVPWGTISAWKLVKEIEFEFPEE